ncbi:MAG: arsenic metallochaperone ArsD family protein [Betaproteobacteria bacterium]
MVSEEVFRSDTSPIVQSWLVPQRRSESDESREEARSFDSAMRCSTGVCGVDVDTVLPRFAADLKWLEEHGVAVQPGLCPTYSVCNQSRTSLITQSRSSRGISWPAAGCSA